jgi:hypothetical protein
MARVSHERDMARVLRAFLKQSERGLKTLSLGQRVKECVMKNSSGFLAGLKRFVRVEDGLVTVEWVALTAGMVVAAVAIGFIVMNNTYKSASKIGGNISSTVTSKYANFGK